MQVFFYLQQSNFESLSTFTELSDLNISPTTERSHCSAWFRLDDYKTLPTPN